MSARHRKPCPHCGRSAHAGMHLTPTADGLLLEIDGPSLTLSDAAVAALRKALQRYEYSRRPRPGENLTGYIS